MSDIQRWTSWCNDPKREDPNGKWVTYADHVAAVEKLIEHINFADHEGFARGRLLRLDEAAEIRRDALAAAVAAVEALLWHKPWGSDDAYEYLVRSEAINAIKAVQT